MYNPIFNKKNVINFFKFLESKITLHDKLIENDVLKFYDFKNKILIIDKTNLISIIKKFNKKALIKTLCILFRSKKIEFPYVYLSINLDIIKNTLTNIFEKSIINKKDINKQNIEFIIDIPLHDINFSDDFNIKNYKNNINYFIINYFAEFDLLNCKRKNNFISPLALIYSENNFLEQMFTELIDTQHNISSLNIKIYIKKNIAFCIYNNIVHLFSIINHLIPNNKNNYNILNIGLDWGEWILLAHHFNDYKFYSYYFNNLQLSTIKNIKYNFETKENIFQEQTVHSSLLEKIKDKYFILFINLDYIFNYYFDKHLTINDIFKVKIFPLLDNIDSQFIVLKNFVNLDYNILVNNIYSHSKRFHLKFNINIDNSIYSIFIIHNS